MSSVSGVSRGRAPRPLTLVTATATVALSVALSGCVSTEQKAAWVHVEDARGQGYVIRGQAVYGRLISGVRLVVPPG